MVGRLVVLLLIANAASYAVEPAVVFGDAEAIHAGRRSVTALVR